MKLKQKLSLLAAGSVLLTVSTAVLFAHVLGKRMIEQTWRSRFQDFTQALALPVSCAISEHDTVLLDAYAYDLIARPALYIHAVAIHDIAGKALVSIPDEETHVSSPNSAGPSLDRDVIPISVPLSWNGESVGKLQIRFTNDPVKQALAKMRNILIGIAGLCSLIAILISMRIADRLLYPLTHLISQIGKLRRNEPVALLSLTPTDEIGEMGNSFLEVYEELRQREQHNQEVVQKLGDTTQQLSDELALNAQLRERLEEENQVLQKQVATNRSASSIIGAEGDLSVVVEQTKRAAHSRLTVLLSGESGTGKEVLAHYVHQASDRHKQSFITVNCAALQENLIESELFGHEKGAFTGATDRKTGKFVLADGGTIFLDEIGELPLHMQPKLLRVLETGQVDRIGSAKPIEVDVRVIAATNRDLAQEVAAGRFREDLYYRLKVVHIEIPPLRERQHDLPVLAEAFLEDVAQEMGIAAPVLSPAALSALQSYTWPGNVRELRHVLAAALAQHPDVILDRKQLSPFLTATHEQRGACAGSLNGNPGASARTGCFSGDFDSFIKDQEKALLSNLLPNCHSQKEMAERLRISEAKLHRLLKKHDLLGWKQHKPQVLTA